MNTADRLEPLMKQALAEGARAAELLHVVERGTRIVGGAVQEVAEEVLTVRVWVDGGRRGEQRGHPSEGPDLVGQALAATFQSPESRLEGPVAPLGSVPDGLGNRDRRYDHLDLSDRQQALKDIRKQLKPLKRFELSRLDYADAHRTRTYTNTRGIALTESTTDYRIDVAITGQELALEGLAASRSFASIATLPLGTSLVKRVERLSTPGRTLPEGPVRVVLPPRPMFRLLAALAPHFTPRELADGSFFLQDGGAPLSDKLHLVDDGGAVGGLRTRSFDDRGVPPVPLTLLREGVVGGRFLSPERARSLDTRPTGHCHDGGLRPNNLVMKEGTRSINALLTELGGPALVLDDLADLSGLDLTTGDLDLRVDGVVMDANEAVGAMRRARLVGNLRDLLENIVHVCNNTDRIAHVDAASIIADGLALAAP